MSEDGRGGDTRRKLLEGAMTCLTEQGIAKTSARTIAAAAGVNQALVFYHFGSVDELLVAAGRHGAEQHLARFRHRFAAVRTLSELLDIGRALHAEEPTDMAALGQLLAGAQTDPRLAPATMAGLELWVEEIRAVLDRVLVDSPLAEFVDVPGLARLVAASFVGLELYGGVAPDGGERAWSALEQLAGLATVLDDQGPIVRRAVRARLRRGTRSVER